MTEAPCSPKKLPEIVRRTGMPPLHEDKANKKAQQVRRRHAHGSEDKLQADEHAAL